ncbi:hypothetical protein ACFFIP_11030 [Fontibacter flavus]|uniref:Uncharacterized protein n=1 Tax=Fontibacter flavus TaxID=654838 RepID=A0ABV6FTQ6_9BACT
MKKLFSIAMFFWACTFTQQAQLKNPRMLSDHSPLDKGKQISNLTLTDSPRVLELVNGRSTRI